MSCQNQPQEQELDLGFDQLNLEVKEQKNEININSLSTNDQSNQSNNDEFKFKQDLFSDFPTGMANSTKLEVPYVFENKESNVREQLEKQTQMCNSIGWAELGLDMNTSTKVTWENRAQVPDADKVDFNDPIFNTPLPVLEKQQAMNFKMTEEIEVEEDFDFELPVLTKQPAMNFTEYEAPAPKEQSETELNLNIKTDLEINIMNQSMDNSIQLDKIQMIESKFTQMELPKDFKSEFSQINEKNEDDDEEFDLENLELPVLKRQDAMNFQNAEVKPNDNVILPPEVQNLLNQLLKDLSNGPMDSNMNKSIKNAQTMIKNGHFGLAQNLVNDMLSSGRMMELSQNNMELSQNVSEYQRMMQSIKMF